MTAQGKVVILSFFFAVCAVAALWTAYLQARADENVKPAELYAIVERQLGDLRGGEFTRAYEYASQGMQERYNVDQFTRMVQADYAGMRRIARVEYGEVETNGEHATMQVFLIGQDGEVMPCVYMMVREGESWKVDGTRLMSPWPRDVRMEGTTL